MEGFGQTSPTLSNCCCYLTSLFFYTRKCMVEIFAFHFRGFDGTTPGSAPEGKLFKSVSPPKTSFFALKGRMPSTAVLKSSLSRVFISSEPKFLLIVFGFPSPPPGSKLLSLVWALNRGYDNVKEKDS